MKRKTVSQKDLAQLYRMRKQRAALDLRIKELDAELVKDFKEGAIAEAGRFTPGLQPWGIVCWQEELIDAAFGKGAYSKLKEKYASCLHGIWLNVKDVALDKPAVLEAPEVSPDKVPQKTVRVAAAVANLKEGKPEVSKS